MEAPSPVHSTAVVVERPKPLAHVNVHELPWLLESEHVGAFPLPGASVERAVGQVMAENKMHCFYQWANTIFILTKPVILLISMPEEVYAQSISKIMANT